MAAVRRDHGLVGLDFARPPRDLARPPGRVARGVDCGQSSTRTTSSDRCTCSPRPPSGSATYCIRVRQRSVGGTSSTTIGRSSPARRCSCSRTTVVFHARWAATSTCWRSHPPHAAGPAYGHAARRHPVDRGGQHRDRVAAPEAVPVAALGDLHDDPLARQGVAHEDDAVPSGLVGGDAGHAVTAVRDRADVDVVPRPHPRGAASGPLARASRGARAPTTHGRTLTGAPGGRRPAGAGSHRAAGRRP